MILEYDWQASEGEAPETGTWLDVSGDPDRPVLRGAVARHLDGDEGITIISILLANGQNGSLEFQNWVITEGNIGVEVSADQRGIPGV